MNISLLLKWWWKLKDPNYSSIWKELITKKYYTREQNHSKVSTVWKNIINLEYIGTFSSKYQIGTGDHVSFWHDIWHEECALHTKFHKLFRVCRNTNVTVKEVSDTSGNILQFSRDISGSLEIDYKELLSLIPDVSKSTSTDMLQCRWSSDGHFHTSVLYDCLNNRGVQISKSSMWWDNAVPHKIKVFMWLVAKNRILTKDQLMKKGWQGDNTCSLCNNADETINHLFLKCPYSAKLWFWMGEAANQFMYWHSFKDIVDSCADVTKNQRKAFLLVLSAVCWSLWLQRNAIIFNNNKSVSVRCLLTKICNYVLFWTGNVTTEVKNLAMQWLPQNWDEIPIAELNPQLTIRNGDENFMQTDEI